MNADTVTGAAATAIALGALWVSYTQGRAARLHSRQAVRPLLQLRRIKVDENGAAGLRVLNAGPGPAIVTASAVRWDGEALGTWNYQSQSLVARSLPERPSAYSLRPGAVLLAGEATYLYSLEGFAEGRHDWFWEALTHRLSIEIHYESLYGGENYSVAPPDFA